MLSFLRRVVFSTLKYLFSRVVALGLIVLLIGAIVGVAYDLHQFLNTPIKFAKDTPTIEIPTGMSIDRLATQLQEQGVIKNAQYFKWYGRLTGQATKLQVGEYRLAAEMYPQDLIALITSGRVVQYAFTIIEGWTFNELRQRLSQENNIKQTLLGLSNDEVMTALGLDGKAYEGYFLPDTYFFPKNYSDAELLKRSYGAMQSVVNKIWEERTESLPIKNIHELLTLASIIEKETGVRTERSKISGVFIRRLQKNMRLQTDPTVIYGLGEQYRGVIYRSDLQKDTPYNTYTRDGLPPTPIAMPSIAAIYAAANPESGKELYFVAKGDGSGEHIFSETYEQHQRAVERYRQSQRD